MFSLLSQSSCVACGFGSWKPGLSTGAALHQPCDIGQLQAAPTIGVVFSKRQGFWQIIAPSEDQY